MGIVAWLVVGALAFSGVVQAFRGLNETTRTYDITDVIGVLIEVPLLIWGVVYLATH